MALLFVVSVGVAERRSAAGGRREGGRSASRSRAAGSAGECQRRARRTAPRLCISLSTRTRSRSSSFWSGAGANVNAANRYGVTPLWLACVNGNAAVIETLLKAGADANTSMPEGETVLMTAARTGKD